MGLEELHETARQKSAFSNSFVGFIMVFGGMLYLTYGIFAEEAGDDLGDGAVAGDVAGCAEAVHGYVEGYHHGIVGVGEAEDRGE